MTTKAELSEWFDNGVRTGAQFMLIICDTFDHEDYPVFCMTGVECAKRYAAPGDMQRVMECYDLRMPKDPQLAEQRAFNLPDEVRNPK